MTPAEVDAKLNELDQVLKGINDHINGLLSNRIVSSIPFVPLILGTIHDMVSNVSHAIEGIIGHIVAQITSGISNLLPGPVDFLIGIADNVFKDVHDILGNLATAEEFVGGAIGEVLRQAGPIGAFITGAVGSAISGGILDLLKFLEGQDAATVDHFLAEAEARIPQGHWLHSMISGLRGRGAEWQALALPLLVGVMLQPIGEAMANPFLEILKQTANLDVASGIASVPDLVEQRLKGVIGEQQFAEDVRKNNVDIAHATQMLDARYQRLLPEEINTLRFRGEIDRSLAESEADQQGVSPTRLDLKREAMRPILSEDEIRQTFLRGIIDRPKHDALMSLHGITQDTINRKVNLYYLIPGPQDLIHMGIRNVFDPALVERFTLAADAPEAFFTAAAQQGISRDWALKFWEAHWIVPGTDQAFTMYQRTVDQPLEPGADKINLLDGSTVYNIIGKETLNLFLKDKDTPPYYREKLAQIAYHPLNRIDVRRMYSVGSLTKVGVQRAYLDLGYSPAHALQLANFVESYYANARKDKAQPIIESLRREALRLYVQDKLSLDDIGFVLADMGFTDTETRYFIAEADLVRHADESKKVEIGVGRLYVSRFISEDDARKRLAVALVPQEAIDTLVNGWNLDREFKQDSEHFHKQRDLTKSELVEAFVDGLITEPDLLGWMELLGYPEAEAQIEVSLAKYRRDKQAHIATLDALKASYVNGVAELGETSNALDGELVPATRRDALLQQWTLQRETRTERIPIATLRDMVRAQFVTTDEAFLHLKRHRYTDDDANLLLDFWTQQQPTGGKKRGA